ncbi:F-box protein CPR1 [Linum grandiflorum]
MKNKRKQAWPERKVTRTRLASTVNDEGSSFLLEDVVLDILVKLPAKIVLRFKCLSTGIHNLIESPYFVAAHAEHQCINHTSIFLLTYRGNCNTNNTTVGVCRFTLPFVKSDSSRWLKIVGSCNGLVCMNIFKNSYSNQSNMVVWNPATSKLCVAPPPSNIPSDDDRVVYGFGYDSVSNDYKSIKIMMRRSIPGLAEAEVLSWGKRRWTMLESECSSAIEEYGIFIRSNPVTSKGRVNWIDARGSLMLLTFKLGKEKFEWISPPQEEYDENDRNGNACVWKGKFAVLTVGKIVTTRSTCLWLFNDDDQDYSCCWSKLFTVQTEFLYEWEWMGKVETNIVRDKWNSFLVYQYDNLFALASMAGELMSGLPYHIRINTVFEFAATLVSVSGLTTS